MYFPIVIAKNYSVEMKDLVGTGAFLAVGVSGSLSHCWHISECRTSAFNLKNIPHVPFLAILRSGIKQVTNRPERAKHFISLSQGFIPVWSFIINTRVTPLSAKVL